MDLHPPKIILFQSKAIVFPDTSGSDDPDLDYSIDYEEFGPNESRCNETNKCQDIKDCSDEGCSINTLFSEPEGNVP